MHWDNYLFSSQTLESMEIYSRGNKTSTFNIFHTQHLKWGKLKHEDLWDIWLRCCLDFWPQDWVLWHQREVGQHKCSRNSCFSERGNWSMSQHWLQVASNEYSGLLALWCDFGQVVSDLSKKHNAFIIKGQAVQKKVLLGAFYQWRCMYHVCLKHRKPFVQWHCITSQKTWLISLIAVKTSDLTGTKVSLTILPLVGQYIRHRHRVFKFIRGREKSVGKNDWKERYYVWYLAFFTFSLKYTISKFV